MMGLRWDFLGGGLFLSLIASCINLVKLDTVGAMTKKIAPKYTIRQAAEVLGISGETLRRWEAEGRIPKPQRTLGGHRRYSEADLWNIQQRLENYSNEGE